METLRAAKIAIALLGGIGGLNGVFDVVEKYKLKEFSDSSLAKLYEVQKILCDVADRYPTYDDEGGE
jgi:hypothetical protein